VIRATTPITISQKAIFPNRADFNKRISNHQASNGGLA
jgi:hypothetical protein